MNKGYFMYKCNKCSKMFKGYKMVAYCKECLDSV